MLNTRFRNGGIRGAGGVPGQHRKCVEDLGQYCTISGAGFGALGTEICRFQAISMAFLQIQDIYFVNSSMIFFFFFRVRKDYIITELHFLTKLFFKDALEEMMEKLQNCPDLVPLQHCSTGANAICRYYLFQMRQSFNNTIVHNRKVYQLAVKVNFQNHHPPTLTMFRYSLLYKIYINTVLVFQLYRQNASEGGSMQSILLPFVEYL